VAWPEQHAKGEATGDPNGVRSSTRLRSKAARGGVHRGGFYGGRRRLGARGVARGGGLAPFINIRALGRGSRPTRTSAKGQGMGKAVAWQPIAVQGPRGTRTAASPLGG
jgi:hypothetical protein